jgi:trans-aconitate methyltransferase
VSTTIIDTKWNASLYDSKHDFVAKYGEDVVDVLDPKAGERILDLGCGTGMLTELIAKKGAQVVGIDSSFEMIKKAKLQYPSVEFQVMNAEDFHFTKKFDAIFSNAALHWVLKKEKAIDCMYDNLQKGGRLVFEMGGKGNVESIINAVRNSFVKRGMMKNAGTTIWYFPSLSEYTTLLEKRGFRVTYAAHFDRETELKDNSNGIKDWLKMFGSAFFKELDELVVNEILEEAQETLRPTNFRNNKWLADYKRLRIVAVK